MEEFEAMIKASAAGGLDGLYLEGGGNDAVYVFTQQLMQEVAEHLNLAEEKRKIHRATAEALEARFERQSKLAALDGSEHAVKAAFNEFDEDGSGAIDQFELKQALRALGLPMSNEEIAKMMDVIDMNGDGEVDLEEFDAMVKASAREQARTSKKVEDAQVLAHHWGMAGPSHLKKEVEHLERAGARARPWQR
jgi:hypothetical protein